MTIEQVIWECLDLQRQANTLLTHVLELRQSEAVKKKPQGTFVLMNDLTETTTLAQWKPDYLRAGDLLTSTLQPLEEVVVVGEVVKDGVKIIRGYAGTRPEAHVAGSEWQVIGSLRVS